MLKCAIGAMFVVNPKEAKMKVCAKCFTERKDEANACPNCGTVEEDAKLAKRPRLPFGLKVNGQAPIGAEMFRGFALTTLQAGDVIEWDWSSCKLTIWRKQNVLWFWKRGRWQSMVFYRDSCGFSFARDVVTIVATMSGFRAVLRKGSAKNRYIDRWVLKK